MMGLLTTLITQSAMHSNTCVCLQSIRDASHILFATGFFILAVCVFCQCSFTESTILLIVFVFLPLLKQYFIIISNQLLAFINSSCNVASMYSYLNFLLQYYGCGEEEERQEETFLDYWRFTQLI